MQSRPRSRRDRMCRSSPRRRSEARIFTAFAPRADNRLGPNLDLHSEYLNVRFASRAPRPSTINSRIVEFEFPPFFEGQWWPKENEDGYRTI
jgi:hypothetical protein